jgi:hypothetical protein
VDGVAVVVVVVAGIVVVVAGIVVVVDALVERYWILMMYDYIVNIWKYYYSFICDYANIWFWSVVFSIFVGFCDHHHRFCNRTCIQCLCHAHILCMYLNLPLNELVSCLLFIVIHDNDIIIVIHDLLLL